MKTIAAVLMIAALSGCAAIDTKKAKVTAYGFYAVHPVYGIVGIGYIDYNRSTVEEPEDK